MTTEAWAAMARKHWKEYLPKKWKELQERGETQAAVMAAAQQAQAHKMQLMRAGYQEHEADEVVRAEFILLKPEPEASGEDDEDRAREAAYQQSMNPLPVAPCPVPSASRLPWHRCRAPRLRRGFPDPMPAPRPSRVPPTAGANAADANCSRGSG
jgi:hypothetical protein